MIYHIARKSLTVSEYLDQVQKIVELRQALHASIDVLETANADNNESIKVSIDMILAACIDPDEAINTPAMYELQRLYNALKTTTSKESE